MGFLKIAVACLLLSMFQFVAWTNADSPSVPAGSSSSSYSYSYSSWEWSSWSGYSSMEWSSWGYSSMEWSSWSYSSMEWSSWSYSSMDWSSWSYSSMDWSSYDWSSYDWSSWNWDSSSFYGGWWYEYWSGFGDGTSGLMSDDFGVWNTSSFGDIICTNGTLFAYSMMICSEGVRGDIMCHASGFCDADVDLDDVCYDSARDIKECMDDFTESCSDDVTSHIISYVKNFCDVDDDADSISDLRGASLKDNVHRIMGMDELFERMSDNSDFDSCYTDVIVEIAVNITESLHCTEPSPLVDGNRAEVLTTYSANIQSDIDCYLRRLTAVLQNCSQEDNLDMFGSFVLAAYSKVFPGVSVRLQPILESMAGEEDPFSAERVTVGVFGDPHLLVYTRDGDLDFVTCSDEGDVDLLITDNIEIYGTYSEACSILSDSSNCSNPDGATFMTEVDIVFMNDAGDVIEELTLDGTNLATRFDSNRTSVPEDDGEELTIEDYRGGVLIVSGRTGIVIYLDEFLRTYTMMVRMSETVMASPSTRGQLKFGCENQITIEIEIEDEATRKKRDTCETGGICQAVAYDTRTTGDEERANHAGSLTVTMSEEIATTDDRVVEQSSSSNNQNNNQNAAPSISGHIVLVLTAAIFGMARLM